MRTLAVLTTERDGRETQDALCQGNVVPRVGAARRQERCEHPELRVVRSKLALQVTVERRRGRANRRGIARDRAGHHADPDARIGEPLPHPTGDALHRLAGQYAQVDDRLRRRRDAVGFLRATDHRRRHGRADHRVGQRILRQLPGDERSEEPTITENEALESRLRLRQVVEELVHRRL